jgi:NADH dehydrogenase (ubiquinone) 1 alpha subcomplex subunit 6
LDLPLEAIRSKIRHNFSKHLNVQDTRAIDVLLHKGAVELEETLMLWKQPSHLLMYFRDEEQGRVDEEDFMAKFYKG